MRDLALQPDTPLQDSRRPPGARIHHVRGIADGARQRLLTRIEVRERDRVRHAVAQREWRGAVFRRAEWLRRTKITGFGRVIIGLRVHEAAADSQHSLGRDLIRDAEPWTECPRIVLRKCAITLSRTIALENDSTRQTARRGIRSRGADAEHVAAVLFQVSLIVVAQTVIQRQFAADFPVVLKEECPRMIPCAHPGWNTVIAGIGRPDQKTRIVESDEGWQRDAFKRR